MTEMTSRRNNKVAFSKEEELVEHSILDTFIKAASACDKFFNCAYVKKQLEDEWQQEERMHDSAVGRVWSKMDKSMEVEVYRQFLFDEDSVGPVPGSSAPTNPPRNSLSPLLYCGAENDYIPGLQRTDS